LTRIGDRERARIGNTMGISRAVGRYRIEGRVVC